LRSPAGASAEGARDGTYNEANFINAYFPDADENLPFLERWGGPETNPHYALGWAVAGNTPFRYYKQTAYEGGTRVPLVLAWPEGISARGEIRSQFSYVTDLAPTVLDVASVELAPVINNVPQSPMDGVSLRPVFADPGYANPDRVQYWELFGNKGIRQGDWVAVTNHRSEPWDMSSTKVIVEPCELFDFARDPGQSVNLAG
jgi:arylsulfatase